MRTWKVAVVKIGGSVLTGRQAYHRIAAYLGERLCSNPDERVVVVVSAENGRTDALLAAARDVTPEPDQRTLDLLWSTGETHACAMLALHLQAHGIRATAAGIHEAGLTDSDETGRSGRPRLRALRLRAVLHTHDVVVVPGFLARGGGDRIVSLGRGGSDVTAVLIAAGLGAVSCELVKDVPGYFTADPKRDPDARPIRELSYERALELADEGCTLVQRHALVSARDCGMPIVIRSLAGEFTTVVGGGAHVLTC